MEFKKTPIEHQFQTPMEVCHYMVRLLPENVIRVLEPTPGIGNLVSALKARGISVHAPGDYFLERSGILQSRYDAVVMNPPFSSKSAELKNANEDWQNTEGMKFGYKMLGEMMGVTDRIICLMPWFTISDSDVRLRSITNFGLRSVTALPRKTFQYARIQTCVIDLEKGYEGITEFRFLEPRKLILDL